MINVKSFLSVIVVVILRINKIDKDIAVERLHVQLPSKLAYSYTYFLQCILVRVFGTYCIVDQKMLGCTYSPEPSLLAYIKNG